MGLEGVDAYKRDMERTHAEQPCSWLTDELLGLLLMLVLIVAAFGLFYWAVC